MKQRAIIFDLDNTLIDTRERHYMLLKEFLLQQSIEPLGYHEYLFLRAKYSYSNINILRKFYEVDITKFQEFWHLNIESEKYLHLDKPIVDFRLLELCQQLDAKYILLSLRSNIQSASAIFETYDFSLYFEELHFLIHSDENPKIGHLRKLKRSYEILFFIGDTQSDYTASRANDIEFYGVETGFYGFENMQFSTYLNINTLLCQLVR